jgi:hypothetical protein
MNTLSPVLVFTVDIPDHFYSTSTMLNSFSKLFFIPHQKGMAWKRATFLACLFFHLQISQNYQLEVLSLANRNQIITNN